MALGVMYCCYSHHQTSGWLIKTKMVVWKPICQEIFCFKLHRQTFIFCCKKFDRKVWCEISFHNLVSTVSLLLLWWTRGLVIRNIFTKQTYQLCPTYKMAPRTNSKKIYYILERHAHQETTLKVKMTDSLASYI